MRVTTSISMSAEKSAEISKFYKENENEYENFSDFVVTAIFEHMKKNQ